jgi:glycerol-3-phosphate acyltransferase PlsY
VPSLLAHMGTLPSWLDYVGLALLLALVPLLVVVSYLLGSIPFALLLGRLRGVDIRRQGSGNIGATNLGRALGRRWAIAAFLLDFAKGLVPVLGTLWLLGAPQWLAVACGAAAVLGHIFPIYLRFRGGKGVATTFGAMTGLAWPAAAIAGVLWLAVYLPSRAVSLASLAAGVSLPLSVFLLPRGYFLYYEDSLLPLKLFALGAAALIVLRHRENIARLLRGEEHSFNRSRRDTSKRS